MPGYQNGAGPAHAHGAGPTRRRSRSRCSSPCASAVSRPPRAPRRAAHRRRSRGRVAPPCRRLGPGECGVRAGLPNAGLLGRLLLLRLSANLCGTVGAPGPRPAARRLERNLTGACGAARLRTPPGAPPGPDLTGSCAWLWCRKTLSQTSDGPGSCRS